MFVSRRRLLQGSLLSAATMAQGSWPALAEVTAASPTADERTRMAALATDFMKAGNIPGLSIAIAIKGKPVYVEGFGVADRETPGSRLRIRTMSAGSPMAWKEPGCRIESLLAFI